MDSAFLFWEKYFNCQIEVTWDEFSAHFSQFIQQYGSIVLDDDQLLFLKNIIDPDYRNVVKIGDYLIFHEIYWKVQSKRQALFKGQFKVFPFNVPKQLLKGVRLRVIALAHGYPDQIPDILITRTHWNSTPLKLEEVFTIGSGPDCDFRISNDLRVNQLHCKLVWTPYNLFLVKDTARSFRTMLRVSEILLDAFMVIQLSTSTMFRVKFIQPLPQSFTQISTQQESLKNQIPDLLKHITQYKSVLEYRERKTDHLEYEAKPHLAIEFTEGPLKGQEYQFTENEYTLGSGKHCSIVIPDPGLQREHCVIRLKNGNWQLVHKEQQYLDPTQFGTFALLANSNQVDANVPSKAQVVHEGYRIVLGPMLLQATYQY